MLNLELDADQFDASQAVNVELEPGQMSLHDVRTLHGSRWHKHYASGLNVGSGSAG